MHADGGDRVYSCRRDNATVRSVGVSPFLPELSHEVASAKVVTQHVRSAAKACERRFHLNEMRTTELCYTTDDC